MNVNYLEHYGVLGMKWGVRRFQNKDGTLTTVGKKKYSSEFINNYKKKRQKEKNRSDRISKVRKDRIQKAIDVDTVSDQDLNKLIDRMNKEKNYINLVNERYKTPSRTKVNSILSKYGSRTVKAAISTASVMAVKSIINLILDPRSKTDFNDKMVDAVVGGIFNRK